MTHEPHDLPKATKCQIPGEAWNIYVDITGRLWLKEEHEWSPLGNSGFITEDTPDGARRLIRVVAEEIEWGLVEDEDIYGDLEEQ